MKCLVGPLFWGWLALLGGCAPRQDFPQLESMPGVENRHILVTFADPGIQRNFSANRLDSYGVHGRYDNSGWGMHRAEELASRHRLALVTQWPITALGVSCVVYQVPGESSMPVVMENLRRDQQVSGVQLLQSYRSLGKTEPRSQQTYSDPYVPLQSGFQSMQIAGVHRIATGRGVRVALVDTGVDQTHPDLQGQIRYWENLAPEPQDHNMADVHGTAVAGVLSARPNNAIGIAGIAPDAEVAALRACWPDAPDAVASHCNSFTLALALNEAIRLHSRIINLSLTGPEDPLVAQLIETALAQDAIVIAALPGKEQPGGFPARLPGVIAVGSEDGVKLAQIVAPGQDILTTVPHGAYDFLSGSSFATPHIAGVVALMLELRPGLTAAEVRQILLAAPQQPAGGSMDVAALLEHLDARK